MIRLTVATQVRGIDRIVRGEARRDVFPVAPVVEHAVEEDEWVGFARTPAHVVMAQAVQSDVAVFAYIRSRNCRLIRHRLASRFRAPHRTPPDDARGYGLSLSRSRRPRLKTED